MDSVINPYRPLPLLSSHMAGSPLRSHIFSEVSETTVEKCFAEWCCRLAPNLSESSLASESQSTPTPRWPVWQRCLDCSLLRFTKNFRFARRGARAQRLAFQAPLQQQRQHRQSNSSAEYVVLLCPKCGVENVSQTSRPISCMGQQSRMPSDERVP